VTRKEGHLKTERGNRVGCADWMTLVQENGREGLLEVMFGESGGEKGVDPYSTVRSPGIRNRYFCCRLVVVGVLDSKRKIVVAFCVFSLYLMSGGPFFLRAFWGRDNQKRVAYNRCFSW